MSDAVATAGVRGRRSPGAEPSGPVERSSGRPWPQLPTDAWWDTLETLHLWTQVVGKIRMTNSPWVNHSWSVPLYVSPRGLRSSLIPYGTEGVELAFDLVEHELVIEPTTGHRRAIPLGDGAVADLYHAVTEVMGSLGMPVDIDPRPSEIPGAVPFDRDTASRPYDRDHAAAFCRALLRADRVLTRFRARFTGKASPVHFFWGGFDLATTRFSGRRAPEHPGGVANLPDDVVREAYSHELSSAGFWVGNRAAPEPRFYAYAYPAPAGYAGAAVEPPEAAWVDDLGEFVLPYAAAACSDDPEGVVLRFLESAHRAAAVLGGWDDGLECAPPLGPDWWRDRPHAASRRPPDT